MNRVWHCLCACLLSLACVTAQAQATQDKPASAPASIPAGAQNMIDLIVLRQQHVDCVLKAMEARGLDKDDAFLRHARTKHLGPQLYKALADHLDEDKLLSGFKPSAAKLSDDELKLQQATFLFGAMTAKDKPEGADALDSMIAMYDYMQVVNVSMDSPCAVPAKIAETEQAMKQLEPLMMEAGRVTECAEKVLKTHGLEEFDAYDALLKKPGGAELRRYLLEQAKRSPMLEDQALAKLDKAGIGQLFYVASMNTMMDAKPDSLVRSIGLRALLLDRALDAGCKPSPELIRFLGVP